MRLISQDGKIDVPYEYGSLSIGVGKYEDCESAVIMYRNISSPNGTVLARYTTEAKAIKAMEMLREYYLKYCTAKSNDYWFAFNNPKAFKFPADSGIEVCAC